MRAAALLCAVVLVATGCGEREGAGPPGPAAETEASWTRAADAPLSARYGALLAWTGDEVLALGGHTGPPCPPSADCPVLDDWAADGAAYDVDEDTWRPLPDPPLDLDQFTAHVVVDGDLVVGDPRGWWRFDGEAWAALPDPPAEAAPEATLDGSVYGHVRRTVHALDLATGTWSALPPDPLQPSLQDAGVFATGAGVVLTGVSYDDAAPDEPTLTQADVWDGTTWRRLPRTGMIGPLYHSDGTRLIGPELGTADGGQVNGWERAYPFGGVLDVATGEWSPLEGTPDYVDRHPDAWLVEAADGPLVATSGYLYDDTTGRWAPLGRPRSDLLHDLAGVWAGDRLVVVGGSDADGELVSEVWVRAPQQP